MMLRASIHVLCNVWPYDFYDMTLARSASVTNMPLSLCSHSIRFRTGSYSVKLKTYYNFCNKVKEGVSAIRRFDWSRENIRHTGITLPFVGLPVPT